MVIDNLEQVEILADTPWEKIDPDNHWVDVDLDSLRKGDREEASLLQELLLPSCRVQASSRDVRNVEQYSEMAHVRSMARKRRGRSQAPIRFG